MRNLLQLGGVLILITLFDGCNSPSKEYSKATVIQTSEAGDKLADKGTQNFKDQSNSENPVIKIVPEQKFQTIVGIGGSFTESSAYLLNELSEEKRNEIINAYFSSEGAEYSLTRTHINSCDFSLNNYAYAEEPGDTELKHFSIDEDKDDIIPFIKDAQKVSKEGFKLISSPWTAPPWMKDNNDWNNGSLKPEYYPTWALYFSKYIKAYEKEGIPVWAITVENEPMGNGAQWESMIYTPTQMADFVKNFLGPQFEQDNIQSKIMVYDQNRDELEEWANIILNDKEASKYIYGTAVHWYSHTVSWVPEALNTVHNQFPDKTLLHTEGCIDAEIPVWKDDKWYWSKLATDWGYDWAADEDKPDHPVYRPVFRYARDIIGGLNSWLVGWVDWNMVLDDKGGPNHASNWCIAPVIVKPETDEVYYTPLYYVMSHFSKYIRPEAQRIGVESDVESLMVTACLNKDNTIAVQVFNPTEEIITYNLELNDKLTEVLIPGFALQTIVID